MPEEGAISPQSLHLITNHLDLGLNKHNLNKEGWALYSVHLTCIGQSKNIKNPPAKNIYGKDWLESYLSTVILDIENIFYLAHSIQM